MLKKIVPELCKDAGLYVHYTNHSLRATAITRMYEGGVPENLISEKSGHKSIKGLRAYEKTSVLQEKAAGSCIDGSKPFHSAVADCTIDKTQVAVDQDVKQPFIDGETVLPVAQPSNNKMPNFSSLQNCTYNFYST